MPDDWEENFFSRINEEAEAEQGDDSSSSDGEVLINEATQAISFKEAQRKLIDLKNYALDKGLGEMFFYLEKSEQMLFEKEISIKTYQNKITAYFSENSN